MFKRTVTIILLLSFLGCAFPKPKPTIYMDADTSVIALVLGEGIARSFAHVGVIKALQEAKIPIHMVVGSGMGSFMGALYANKGSANDLEWHALSFQQKDYFDYTLLQKSELIAGSRLRKFLNSRLVHTRIERLPILFISVTTDLKTGQPYLFEEGLITEAVQAGMAIPGIFSPIQRRDKLLVSGEIRQGIPVDVAIQKGADLIIAVDLTQGIDRYRFSKGRDMAIQSYKIASAALSQEQLKKAHVVIRPDVAHIDFLDFSAKRQAMLAGYEAAKQMLPDLYEILSMEEE